MGAYIVRRLLYAIPVLLGVTLITFLLLNVVGDPAETFAGKSATPEQIEALRAKFGLNKSLFFQYVDYLKQIVTFDFGTSWVTEEPVDQMLWRAAGPSASFTLPALFITSFLSICIGMIAAFYRTQTIDRGLMMLAVLGMSISFLVYIVVGQYLFAFRIPLFPIHGYEAGVDRWQYLVLPVIILVIVSMGYDTRFYRSVFAEEVGRDHVTTAYAKGAGQGRVMFLHVLKNALIPIITRIMISLPFLVTGSLLLETFFGIPGMGAVLLDALNSTDFPVIRTYTVMLAALFVFSILLNDILYAVVDPRVRLK